MTEKDTAIWMANKALEVPNADPDDELRTISRQFLRSIEQLKQERNKAIDECIDAILDESTAADKFVKFSYQKCKSILEKLKSDSK